MGAKDSSTRPGESKEIESFYVAVVVHPDGSEGICAAKTPLGWMPLTCSSQSALEEMMAASLGLARILGEPVRIVRFKRECVLREIKSE